MKKNLTKREEEKVKEIAREYEKKGYTVIVHPNYTNLPEFIKRVNYQPDLVAFGKNENLVFEVSSSASVKHIASFANAADSIKKQEGWDFVFVMTNPKEKEPIKPVSEQDLANKNSIIKNIKRAQRLTQDKFKDQYFDAAFLLAWAVLESAIRLAFSKEYGKKESRDMVSMIRDAIMYGIVSNKDGQLLEKYLLFRNRIAHGFFEHKITRNDVGKVLDLSMNIVKGLEDNK